MTAIITPRWRNIDSAPRDGTPILTLTSGCVATEAAIVMWWTPEKAERCGFGWEAYEVSHMLAPELWMPLPDPPEEGDAIHTRAEEIEMDAEK